ncbi:hypothetical protein LguiB_002780 [Lonicera macranthoides]
MEALWNLEDKLKLSTQQATLLFICIASLVIGLCTATALRKLKIAKRNKKVNQEPELAEQAEVKWPEPQPRWVGVKKVLMGSVLWSGACKWEERGRGGMIGSRQRAAPLLVRGEEVGWQSNNSVSPVWQRPILMGEKCELPRFSGLILYDERGRPVHSDGGVNEFDYPQEQTVVRTTLRDLL